MTAVLDQIIPASADKRMPAAGALGIAEFLENEIRSNEELQPVYERGIGRITELSASRGAEFRMLPEKDKTALLKQVETEEDAFFKSLIRITYMGYYSRSDIRALLKLSAAPVHPDGYHVAPETSQTMAALTEPVVQRGRCYRSV